MTLRFFPNPQDLRKWFEDNHDTEEELHLGYYKKSTGIPSVTWEESVEQALCFGWIDSIRNTIDDKSYRIRFTPRRKGSVWSRKNIDTVNRLIAEGLMKDPGLKAFENMDEKKSAIYSFENEKKELPPELNLKLQKNKKAYEFFVSQPPSYRKTVINWITSAKRPETLQKRFEELLHDSECGLRIKALRRS